MGARFEVADLKRAFSRFQDDHMTDHAAGLTYYALLALFPSLLFMIAVLGLVGDEGLVTDAVEYLDEAGAPPETIDPIRDSLRSAVQADTAAVGALALGLVTTLYGASGAFAAVGRALNVVWQVPEGRSFVRRKLLDLGWTLVALALIALTLVLVFLGGDFAADVLGAIGLGESVAAVWSVARWPAALVTLLLLYALMYWAAPNARLRRFEWITPGAVTGVMASMIGTIGFFLYVSNFDSYNKTYGTFAGMVILLVWLWLANVMLLFGAELNAVIRLRRCPESPRPPDGPLLAPKVPKKDQKQEEPARA